MKSRLPPIFFAIASVGALVWWLVHPVSTGVYSQLVSREIPSLSLPSARPGQAPLTTASFATGKPRLLNLFGSWCIPCIAEAPQLMRLRREGVTIDGIAIRDRPAAVAAFLAGNGDPFAAIGLDPDSRAQRELGSSAVPETFVVDGQGVIRRQFIGGLDAASLPAVRQALAEAAR